MGGLLNMALDPGGVAEGPAEAKRQGVFNGFIDRYEPCLSHWEPEELVNTIITENSFVILLAFPVDDLITWRGPLPCQELYRSQLRWPAPGLKDNNWAIEMTRNEEHRAARQATDESA